jgi:hypothetical protein
MLLYCARPFGTRTAKPQKISPRSTRDNFPSSTTTNLAPTTEGAFSKQKRQPCRITRGIPIPGAIIARPLATTAKIATREIAAALLPETVIGHLRTLVGMTATLMHDGLATARLLPARTTVVRLVGTDTMCRRATSHSALTNPSVSKTPTPIARRVNEKDAMIAAIPPRTVTRGLQKGTVGRTIAHSEMATTAPRGPEALEVGRGGPSSPQNVNC